LAVADRDILVVMAHEAARASSLPNAGVGPMPLAEAPSAGILAAERKARAELELELSHLRKAHRTAEQLLAYERHSREGIQQRFGQECEGRLAAERALAEERGARADAERRLAWETAARLDLETQLAAVVSSRSWRVLRPLRGAKEGAIQVWEGGWAWLSLQPGSAPRRVARHGVRRIWHAASSRPRLARFGKRVLERVPALEHRLRPIVEDPEVTRIRNASPEEVAGLSPSCGLVYLQMRAAARARFGYD